MLKSEQAIAALVGLIFAAGLAIGGMTMPSKVVGFFDFHEGLSSWDPSLALVMGGGVAVYLPAYLWIRKRGRPLLSPVLEEPKKSAIDGRLLLGAVVFGLGWGLVGFCPGPALASVGAGSWQAVIVVAAMTGGFWLFRWFDGSKA